MSCRINRLALKEVGIGYSCNTLGGDTILRITVIAVYDRMYHIITLTHFNLLFHI